MRREYLTSIVIKEKEYVAMERFMQVMEFWSEDVAHFARRIINYARILKPLGLPLAQDLQRQHKYLIIKKTNADRMKYEDKDFSFYYYRLAQVLMCQIIMINCKRANEVHAITLESFLNMDPEIDPDLLNSLDRGEQDLATNIRLLVKMTN